MTARTEQQPVDMATKESARVKVVTPRMMEAEGGKLGSGLSLSRWWPFLRRVAPYPPKDSREMPRPVAEVYQLAVRKTHDHERDYRQEDERLRQEVAADTQTIDRAAGAIGV